MKEGSNSVPHNKGHSDRNWITLSQLNQQPRFTFITLKKKKHSDLFISLIRTPPPTPTLLSDIHLFIHAEKMKACDSADCGSYTSEKMWSSSDRGQMLFRNMLYTSGVKSSWGMESFCGGGQKRGYLNSHRANRFGGSRGTGEQSH